LAQAGLTHFCNASLRRENSKIFIPRQGTNVSLRKIIKAIIAGERDPVQLCRLVHGRTRNKHGEQVIIDALSGVTQQADVEILIQCMEPLLFRTIMI
jgi:hypothetical protein